ncbi:MAG TPA: hypothetical protein P5277_02195 [Candidatus Paceibacterota bacterium]|nr:hypothetical protein [Candidatus Paceibacterota bacterium]
MKNKKESMISITKRFISPKVFYSGLSVIIIVLIVLSAPTEAFFLDTVISNTNPERGEVIFFQTSLNFDPGEIIPIEYFSFELNGPEKITCNFYPNKTLIYQNMLNINMTTLTGCEKLDIKLDSITDYVYENLSGNYNGTPYNWGYGYGYGYESSYGNYGKISYNISLNTSNLLSGEYSVKFKLKGYLISISTPEQKFIIPTDESYTLDIYSPNSIEYNSTRILFNLSTSKIVSKLEYFNVKTPSQKILLCRNCNSVSKLMSINDGKYNITIRATDLSGQIKDKNVSLTVDTKKPKIFFTSPSMRLFTNGSVFFISYSEDNLKDITLFYGNNESITKEDCPSGQSKKCYFNIDLSSYDSSKINYSFEIKDITNHTLKSRNTNVNVDTTSPSIIVKSPTNMNYLTKNIPFNITISEKTKIAYIDYSSYKPRWNTLCTNCNSYGDIVKRLKYFSPGIHNITIKSTDMAGNSAEQNISFNIV